MAFERLFSRHNGPLPPPKLAFRKLMQQSRSPDWSKATPYFTIRASVLKSVIRPTSGVHQIGM